MFREAGFRKTFGKRERKNRPNAISGVPLTERMVLTFLNFSVFNTTFRPTFNKMFFFHGFFPTLLLITLLSVFYMVPGKWERSLILILGTQITPDWPDQGESTNVPGNHKVRRNNTKYTSSLPEIYRQYVHIVRQNDTR